MVGVVGRPRRGRAVRHRSRPRQERLDLAGDGELVPQPMVQLEDEPAAADLDVVRAAARAPERLARQLQRQKAERGADLDRALELVR